VLQQRRAVPTDDVLHHYIQVLLIEVITVIRESSGSYDRSAPSTGRHKTFLQ
jgi:hypothetical protein